jgi:glycolate oxidase
MNAPAAAPSFAVARQREVVDALNAVLPPGAVLFNEEDTRQFEC